MPTSSNIREILIWAAIIIASLVWLAFYLLIIDRLLRRLVGALFNVHIEWRRSSGNRAEWRVIEEEREGCLLSMVVGILCYGSMLLFVVAPWMFGVWLGYRLTH
ncbi:MAG: hypothetical protein AUG51_22385 [Acidobacteria bacterium 13_1_20CM_3_53_8]|nr:MAG: hypothetical protein AUG51_22385 [Acidobacteria bacterium 13_1_20CM_3_53_8]